MQIRNNKLEIRNKLENIKSEITQHQKASHYFIGIVERFHISCLGFCPWNKYEATL
jgi:hypothetical protein